LHRIQVHRHIQSDPLNITLLIVTVRLLSQKFLSSADANSNQCALALIIGSGYCHSAYYQISLDVNMFLACRP